MEQTIKIISLIAVVGAVAWGVFYFTQTRTPEIDDASNPYSINTPGQGTTTQTNNQPTTSMPTTDPNGGSNVPTQTVYGAVISTNMGDIEISFDPKNAPNTVGNFVSLAIQHFYDGIKFHRVIPGFMIQVGDPLTRDAAQKARWGTGGPGYTFKDELTGNEKYTEGTVAMANAGPNTNGSQFFIVTASPSVALPPSYTVFGHVVKGMDVAHKIEAVKTESPDRPIDDVIIKSVTLK